MFSSDERIAIEELAHDYCALAEAGEVGALVGLFSEDALFEGRLGSWAEYRKRQPHMSLYLLGREPLRHFFATAGDTSDEHARFTEASDAGEVTVSVLHIPVAHSIVQTGADSADMVCYLTYQYLEDPPLLMAYGRYDDRFVRVDGEWKIAERLVAIEWDGRIDEPGVPRQSPYPWPLPEAACNTLSAEDRNVILEVAARYCHTAEYQQWDALLDLFTKDVRFGTYLNSWAVHSERVPDLRLALRGHGAIHDFFAGSADGEHRRVAVREGNVGGLTTHSIDGDGERASMVSHFTFHAAGDASVTATVHGRYEDRLIKVRGQWKFAHRYVALDCDERPGASDRRPEAQFSLESRRNSNADPGS